jgi:NAD(P)-dependent dehydrogenase (short-subunit alcohol dehydrogenase family)
MPAYDLNGRVALVTGAARGIGFETARQLHMRGASVALLDLDAEASREAAERVGERTLGIGADVTDSGAMLAAVAETVDRFGGLDVAVANAGIAPPTVTTTRAMPPEEWEKVVDINLMGTWHTVRAALPQVSEQQGQLVLTGSILSYANGFLGSPYAVSKAAVEALGRSLRTELAPFGASATVAYYGWVDTELVKGSLDRQEAGRWLEETQPRFMLRRITPEEAAAGLARGIEQRAPRVFVPRFPWRYFSALRGLVNPLFDHRSETHPAYAKVVREAEAEATARGSGDAGRS